MFLYSTEQCVNDVILIKNYVTLIGFVISNFDLFKIYIN
jgi:hypothetical protein